MSLQLCWGQVLPCKAMTEARLNYGQLERVYVLANTPSYLVRNFREEESVRRLARESSAAALKAYLRQVTPRRRLRETVAAYAVLVALGSAGVRLTKQELEALESAGLHWARVVDALASEAPVATTAASLQPPPRIEVLGLGHPSSDAAAPRQPASSVRAIQPPARVEVQKRERRSPGDLPLIPIDLRGGPQ